MLAFYFCKIVGGVAFLPNNKSDALSVIMIVGIWVFPEVILGMID